MNTSKTVIDGFFALGTDDPVGIQLIWPDNGGAHYVTAWSDGVGGLVVTDSDDGDINGPLSGSVTLAWNGNDVLMYHGIAATVGYLFYLSEVPEPNVATLVCLSLALLGWVVARRRGQATASSAVRQCCPPCLAPARCDRTGRWQPWA